MDLEREDTESSNQSSSEAKMFAANPHKRTRYSSKDPQTIEFEHNIQSAQSIADALSDRVEDFHEKHGMHNESVAQEDDDDKDDSFSRHHDAEHPDFLRASQLNDSNIIIDGVLQSYPPRGRFTLPRLQYRLIMNDKNVIQPVQRFNYIELKPGVAYRTKEYVPPGGREAGIDIRALERLVRPSAAQSGQLPHTFLDMSPITESRSDDENMRRETECAKALACLATKGPEFVSFTVSNPTHQLFHQSEPSFPSSQTTPQQMEAIVNQPLESATNETEEIAKDPSKELPIDGTGTTQISSCLPVAESSVDHLDDGNEHCPLEETNRFQIDPNNPDDLEENSNLVDEKCFMMPVQQNQQLDMDSCIFDFMQIRAAEERLLDIPPGWRHRVVDKHSHHSSQLRKQTYRASICTLCMMSNLPLLPCNGSCGRLFHPNCVGIRHSDFIIPQRVLKNRKDHVRKPAVLLPGPSSMKGPKTKPHEQDLGGDSSTSSSDTLQRDSDESVSDDSGDSVSMASDDQNASRKSMPKHHIRGWMCDDCILSKHSCGYCGKHGQDGSEVTKCVELNCGTHFHAKCVKKAFLSVELLLPANAPKDTTSTKALPFRCPCHLCHKCLLPGNRANFACCASCTATFHVSCLSGKHRYLSHDTILCTHCLEVEEGLNSEGVLKKNGEMLPSVVPPPVVTPDSFSSSLFILSGLSYRIELVSGGSKLFNACLLWKEKPNGGAQFAQDHMPRVLDISQSGDLALLAHLSLLDATYLEIRPYGTEDLVNFMSLKETLVKKNKAIFSTTKTGLLIVFQAKPFRKLPASAAIYKHGHVIHGKILKRRGADTESSR
eukprot:TRINITY_DN11846_c0_g1_i1.p1 TRINITY_DN11846_c0_g1~~TRINITY_DN11846_c0_g1_i1.p1  ORF type:complete len:832 (-),score=159.32 TRINITY_DN11846_c0_g1_i1:291-2786(-)